MYVGGEITHTRVHKMRTRTLASGLCHTVVARVCMLVYALLHVYTVTLERVVHCEAYNGTHSRHTWGNACSRYPRQARPYIHARERKHARVRALASARTCAAYKCRITTRSLGVRTGSPSNCGRRLLAFDEVI